MSRDVQSMYMRYFMYSAEESARNTRVHGKSYKDGTVIVRGVPKPYTSIVTDPNSTPPDAILVTKGDIRKINYTESSR